MIYNISTKVIFQLALLLWVSSLWGQIGPVEMTCSDKDSPVGIHQPYFGWQISSSEDEQQQTAYQILIASSQDILSEDEADIWNSGKVISGLQDYIYASGISLESAKQYYWKVKLWNKDDVEGSYSESAVFATGLLSNSDWSGAKWIKRNNDDNEDYTFYRKSFSLNNTEVSRAVVYVSAVHDFELYINGELIGKGPGYHYPQYQFYKAFDITSLIDVDSDNVFAGLTHWYGGGQGRPTSSRGFILKAIVEYTDGSQTVISTDSTWKQIQNEAFVTGQSSRNGEGIGYIDKIDSRKVIADWNSNAFDDTDWNNADEIGEQPVSPWEGNLQPNFSELIEGELEPVSVESIGGGSYIIDLGKVYAGVPKITFTGGTAGTLVSILGGYTLASTGKVSTETDQNTDMSYSIILNGDTAVFQPMVYLGMRYIQVDNSPCELTESNVAFITRRYEVDPSLSYFTSSSEMLNQVYDLMKHSVVVGTQESFVDTPTREKGGFLGDSWSVGVSALESMNEVDMNLQVLNQFLCSQDQYWSDGRLNAVYPNVDGKRDIPDYTQMFLFYVWDYYMHTGNKEFLIENFERLQKVATYVSTYISSKSGLIHNLAGGSSSYKYGIIDWPAVMRYDYDMSVQSRTVQDVYAYLDFKIMAQIAAEIDSTTVESQYTQLASDMETAINQSLINSKGIYIDGLNSDLTQSSHASQHANMLPLAAGIVLEDNKEAVIEKIKDDEMSVGMVTLKWLPEAIGKAGEGEHLFELFTNTEWDGWAKTISLGGTTTWESWDALTSGESMSHPWGAVGLIGINHYFLGIEALEPQYERIQVKPLWFGDKLTSVEGAVPTVRGTIKSAWQTADSTYTLTITIPNNITADVYVPADYSADNVVTVNNESIECEKTDGFYYVGELASGTYEISRPISADNTSSINGNNTIKGIKIYPNPANKKATVDLGKDYECVTVTVRDALGNVRSENKYYNSRYCKLKLKDSGEEEVLLVTVETVEKEKVTFRLLKN